MVLSENAIRILEKRYFKKDSNGNMETPADMFKRVAGAIAGAEKTKKEQEKYETEFYDLLSSLDFMPNSPCLMNAGNETGQLSACFVLPIEDSMESIFETLKHMALVQKTGGGTGFSFSRLRPAHTLVKSTGGTSSGPISFLKIYDAGTEGVKQGGKRRGANMGILQVDHPDILEFIQAKDNEGMLSNFNLSVSLTDEFINACLEDRDYALIDPHTRKITSKISAKKVFETLVYQAWKNGEPGLIFIDTVNKLNTLPHLGLYEACNPCGEQILFPYESCVLGSINSSNMVYKTSSGYKMDYDKLYKVVQKATRFLDNIIDVNSHPIPQIEEMTLKTRKIGLGVMGWGETLVKLGVPYDSDEAVNLAKTFMEAVLENTIETSKKLAEEKGVFPAWEGSIFEKENIKRRNSAVTTIAPTGTISLICNTSQGIEPLFSVAMKTKRMDEEFIEVNKVFEDMAKEKGFWRDSLPQEIIDNDGKLDGIKDVPEQVQNIFVTAREISPEYHIKMQAAFQEYTENAVSKTINLPENATVKEIEDAYLMAHKLGIKGLTVYRDKSREEQVLNTGKTQTEGQLKVSPRPRSTRLAGETSEYKTGCGTLFITINRDEIGVAEVFATTGKRGGCPGQSEAAARLASISLRSGVDPWAVIKQLKGIRCKSCINSKTEVEVLSCPDGIGKELEYTVKKYGDELVEIDTFTINPDNNDELCPDCNNILQPDGGCFVCVCGFSRCGG